MTITEFWGFIDKARESTDGQDQMYESLVGSLAKLDVPQIMEWKQIFDAYQRLSYKPKLWAAAFVINGGCSDDGFDYFRGWLTAQGKKVFLQALKDPDSLADEVDPDEAEYEFEDMLAVGASAYFARTGTKRDYRAFYAELKHYPLSETLTAEMEADITYAPDIDTQWDEGDDLTKLLPRLCKEFDWE